MGENVTLLVGKRNITLLNMVVYCFPSKFCTLTWYKQKYDYWPSYGLQLTVILGVHMAHVMNCFTEDFMLMFLSISNDASTMLTKDNQPTGTDRSYWYNCMWTHTNQYIYLEGEIVIMVPDGRHWMDKKLGPANEIRTCVYEIL